MASGLKVNFNKSCLIGLNIEEEEMERATQFLYCKSGDIPFNFLGIPIGANPRLSATWKPVIKKLRDRLSKKYLISLFAEWKWMFLTDKGATWYGLLLHKYNSLS